MDTVWRYGIAQTAYPDVSKLAKQHVDVDETKIEIDRTGHPVWAAVDCETLEVLTIEASPGRSSFDALLFLKDVLERSHRPLVRANRGPWYD